MANDSSLLPSNTLVIRVAPHGDFFYLPQRALDGARDLSRPPSPLGYSDTELDYPPTSKRRDSGALRGEVMSKSLRETKMKRSAPFGDLFKYAPGLFQKYISDTHRRLVQLQAVIADTRDQLDQIIDACNRLLEEDQISGLVSVCSQHPFFTYKFDSAEKYCSKRSMSAH